MGQPVASAIAAERLFGGGSSFVRGVVRLADCPAPTRPEIAFCGRSNVGKSSLINALVRRKALARSSKTPGRTRQLNYFDLAGAIYLVDLPGMGYARVPRTDKRAWNILGASYVRKRATLVRVLLLVDVRRGLGPLDRDFLDLLCAAAVPARILLTKADAVSGSAGEAMLEATRTAVTVYPAAQPEPVMTSARSGLGLDALRSDIASLIGPVP